MAGSMFFKTVLRSFKPIISWRLQQSHPHCQQWRAAGGQTWGNDHAPGDRSFIATRLTVIKGLASIRYGSDAVVV